MPPTSRSRIRKRRAQLLTARYLPVGEEAWWLRRSGLSNAEVLDDQPMSFWSGRLAAALFVLACGAVAALAVLSVRATDDLHAYEHAPTCDPSTATSIACREEIPVTIAGAGTTGISKSPVDYVDVSGLLLPQTQMRIELRDGSPVWPIVATGDDATVELWHGSIVAITDNYVTGESRDAPRARTVAMVSYTLVALAGAGMSAAYWLRIWRARRYRGAGRPRWLMPLGQTAILTTVGFFFAALLGSHFESIVMTIIADGAIALLVVVSFTTRWWLARPRRT